MGHTPRRLNRATGEWEDGETSYYTIKCWRRLAVNVKGCLRKGDMILVRGKVVMRTWVDDQQRNRVQMQVEADAVGHDLAFGWSHFNRGDQSPWNATRTAGGRRGDPTGRRRVRGRRRPGCPGRGRGRRWRGDPGDPVMADAEFEKLASDLGAEPDVAPVF